MQGYDAMSLSVMFGRSDVMRWLHHSVDVFKNISDERRAELIMLAVANTRCACLSEFVKPRTEGGFGWSLDIRHRNGKTPVSLAVDMKSRYMLVRLVLPKEDNGFGLAIDEASLRKFEQETYHSTPEDNNASYQRQGLSRTSSYVDLSGLDYVPTGTLATTRRTCVRLFSEKNNPQDRLVVKSCAVEIQCDSGSWKIFSLAEKKSREAAFMALLYPGQGPFLVAHFIENNKYHSRTIFKYKEGIHPIELAKTLTSEMECAHMVMAISLELRRIHGHRVVHRDIRSRNILVKKTKDMAESEEVFIVYFIDMENAGYVGERVGSFTKTAKYLAPETFKVNNSSSIVDYPQDIFSLAYLLRDVVCQFEKTLPCIVKFILLGLSPDPNCRPKLDDFITELARDIEESMLTRPKRHAYGC